MCRCRVLDEQVSRSRERPCPKLVSEAWVRKLPRTGAIEGSSKRFSPKDAPSPPLPVTDSPSPVEQVWRRKEGTKELGSSKEVQSLGRALVV